MVEDQPIGLIWAGSTAELDEMDLQLITSLANIAANAIHRAALYEQTLHRLDELNALRSIDQAINSSTDLHLTLDLIVKQLKNLSGADAVDILIYHPALMTLRYAAGEGFQTEEIRKSTLRIGEGGAGRVALEQQPLWISDMRQAEGECVRKELLMAEGFTAYHAFPLVVKGEIKGVLEVFQRAPFSANDDWKDTLETVATQTAIAIDNSEMFDGMKRLNTELILAYDETIEGWAAALELRDHDTEGHSRRVTEHTLTMARAAGMSPDELTHVRRGALLHDIGKIGVPDNILQKPGPLDDNEWIIMREHPKISYQLLSKVMYLKPALDIPYCHHEHWDGSGYPRGLKGEEIPLAARLFTVVDVYDALTSDRPYRKAWTREQALKHIKAEAGKQFDPKVVKLFLKTLDY
jgi:HD-GYP domain-containing protein (c-di-GMP phosphodiesterase class II)